MSISHVIVEWQEDGFPIGIIPLRNIEEPRKEYKEYKEDDIVQARCLGFEGRYPAKLLKFGESVKDLKKVQERILRTPKETQISSQKKHQKNSTPTQKQKDGEKEEMRKNKFQERRIEAQHRREARRIRMEELDKLLDNTVSAGTISTPEAASPVSDDSDLSEDNAPIHMDASTTSTPASISPIHGIDNSHIPEDNTPVDMDLNVAVNAKGYPTTAMKVPRQQPMQDTECRKCQQLEYKYKEEMKKVDVLKCKLADALKETQQLKDRQMEENSNAGHSYAVPKPGILSRDIATKYKMVELVPASSVFVYPHDLEEIKKVRNMAIAGTVTHGCRMAKLLMNKFWRKNELIGATISTEGCPSKIVLDQHIVRAIKAYCVSNSEATPGKIRQAMASKITSINAKERRPVKRKSSEV